MRVCKPGGFPVSVCFSPENHLVYRKTTWFTGKPTISGVTPPFVLLRWHSGQPPPAQIRLLLLRGGNPPPPCFRPGAAAGGNGQLANIQNLRSIPLLRILVLLRGGCPPPPSF